MNENNLIPLPKRTKEEQREICSKGGKKSAESRRRKKALKALMTDLLASDITDTEIYNSTADMGYDIGDMTYGAAITAAMVRAAAAGDVKAFNAIVDLIGEGGSGEAIKLRKKQLALQEQKLNNDECAPADDGFLKALEGSATEDWSDEE